ncbi:hypothetical protein L208DRAFT_1257550, partial [Tricholoma matsutake]
PLSTLCKGFSYHWSLGTPCLTYPLSLHDQTKPGFTLLAIEPSSSTIHVHALTCQGSSPARSKSCLSCQDQALMNQVKVIEDHAQKAPKHLNFATLSQEQCRKYVGNIRKRWKLDRCRGLNVKKALRHAQDCEKMWRTLANLISTHNILALHWLF